MTSAVPVGTGACAAAFLAAGMLSAASLSVAAPIVQPGEWKADFESGTTDAWESYPPFEDTAYDFTLYPAGLVPKEELRGSIFSGGEAYPPSGVAPPDSEDGNSFYLLRGQKPDGTFGGKLGMWCITHRICSSIDTIISFQYWLDDRTASSELHIHLAGDDGRRYVATIQPARREWASVALPRGEFHALNGGGVLPAGIGIDAIAIYTEMEESDPSAFAYLGIDNVGIGGGIPVMPDWEHPFVARYPHWKQAFVENVLSETDSLGLAVRLPQSVEAASITLSFGVRPETATTIDLVKSDGIWTALDDYKFADADPFGPWTASLRGTAPARETIEESFRFWRLATPPSQRPRLLFGQEDIERLRTRVRETERGRIVMEEIRNNARIAREGEADGASARAESPAQPHFDVLGDDYLLRDIDAYFSVLRAPGANALANAFVHLVDGNEEAGKYAREEILRFVGWETWLHPNFKRLGRSTYYPVGMGAMHVALACEMIDPLLSDEDREAIRDGVARNAIDGAWDEYFLHRRVANSTSNWISGTNASPLLAILGMYDKPSDFPREFVGLAEPWLAHLKLAHPGDGSYGEGQGYHAFSAYNSAPTMEALKRVYGVDRLAENCGYNDSASFTTYVAVGDVGFIDMGDGENRITPDRPFHSLLPLAHDSRDPVLNHFVARNPGKDWRELVWPVDEAIAAPPDGILPPSRVFEGKGSVVLRTSWDPEGIALHFRAGPNFNHTHADQGNFLLWGHGERLVSEGGLSMYYDDPYSWSYFNQAGAHNVLIVDGNMQSQEIGDFDGDVPAFANHARVISHAITGTAGIVRSDLQAVYSRTLDHYERKLAFTPQGDVLVIDAIATSGGPRDLRLHYHPPIPGRTTVDGEAAIYRGDNATLTIKALLPKDVELDLLRVPAPIKELRAHATTPAKERNVLRIGSTGKAENAEFVTAYLPASGEGQPSQVEMVDAERGEAARITNSGEKTLLLFGEDGVEAEGIESDASLLMRNRNAMWLLDATFVRIDGKNAWRGHARRSGAMERTEKGWKETEATP